VPKAARLFGRHRRRRHTVRPPAFARPAASATRDRCARRATRRGFFSGPSGRTTSRGSARLSAGNEVDDGAVHVRHHHRRTQPPGQPPQVGRHPVGEQGQRGVRRQKRRRRCFSSEETRRGAMRTSGSRSWRREAGGLVASIASQGLLLESAASAQVGFSRLVAGASGA